MRCLYCGKELALLKRLTGGGEFCSDSHKQSYQEEYNRLALSRLLQAQSKTGESKAAKSAAGNKATPPSKTVVPVAAPVAVEEPIEEVVVKPVSTRKVEKEVVREEPVVPEPSFTPPDMAGFLWPKLAMAFTGPASPYVERWLDSAAAPSTPEWQFHDGSFTLPAAQLLPLDIHPGIWNKAFAAPKLDAEPKEFASEKPDLNLPLDVQSAHAFDTAGPIALDVHPKAAESGTIRVNDPVEFRFEVVFQVSPLLERSQSRIEFSPDGAEVSIETQSDAEVSSEAIEIAPQSIAEIVTEPVTPPPASETASIAEPGPPVAVESEATPRAALEALSRLHHDLVEHNGVDTPSFEPPVSVHAQPVEESLELAPPPGPSALEPASPEALGFLTIPLKTFAPAKPTVTISANAMLTWSQPLLPKLKALPLRPKVSMAPPGFAQPERAVPVRSPLTEAKLKSAPGPVRPDVQRKPLPTPKLDVKQSVETDEVAKPAPPAKPQPNAKPEQPTKESPPARAARSTETVKTSPAKAVPPRPAVEPPQATPPPPKTSSMREPFRPAAPRKEESHPKPAPPPAQGQPSAPAEPTLTFESLQLQLMANSQVPFWGSLKFKVGIAILLVVGVGVGYLGWGNKTHKPTANASAASDSTGPSIMVGEGGWVQGWAGDTVGAHLGRQITIYRPSLTLSDYRVEFQGQIESKSLGWVFRAADPDNYYAMKLATVSSGLPLKVALIKYMILRGHETELGRIPLDQQVSPDTVFSVRMDVRGPRFNTYIQGQPVDIWTNDQLKTGGVGFLNERSERGKIKSVSISYLNGVDK